MADVKNFGLIGVNDNVQYGKGGPRILQTGGAFQFKNAANNANVGITSAGGSMTATLTMSGGSTQITLPNAPLAGTDATNKDYVDAIAAGLTVHPPSIYVEANALTATYLNGTGGVGATLTNAGTQVAYTPDGTVTTTTQRILVKSFGTGIFGFGAITPGSGYAFSVATFTPGSGYNGTAPGGPFSVTLTGGTGSGATADITVDGTGAVTTIVLTSPGTGNLNGDTLIATGEIIGSGPAGAGFTITVASQVYSAVPLTGGAGNSATANITVDGTGGVTSVTLVAPGTAYVVGNSLSAASANLGNTGGSAFAIPVASLQNAKNGVYTVTTVGSGATNWVLTRATDFDSIIEVKGGDFVYNQSGATYASTGWVQTVTPTAIGVSSLIFQQFSGPGEYTAGTGLTLLGSQFSLTVPVTAVTGGTGQTVYAVGDILYASTTTALSRLADVAVGSYLRSGGVTTAPVWSTTILPNSATVGDIMVATTANTYTNLADIAVGNALISGGIGVAPSWDKIGLTTHVSGILPTPNGGTGLSIFVANEVFYAGSTSTVAQSTNFLFDGTSTMTVGGANPLTLNGATATIAATTTDSNITLTPNGTGTVIIGPAGAGIIKSDTAQPLKVTGTTILTLESGAGDIIMLLAGTTANKVTVSGPTAANYIVGLADEDLVNKYYVDTVAGSAAGDVKAFKQVVLLSADGTTNIGTVPATGATILSVKVNVTATNPTATLSVGVAGDVAGYMLTTENDLQTTGLYVAETMVVNTAAQIIATVAGQTTGVGSATVIVIYQIAN